jgi:putative hydrolase of the HAD superfamily
MTPEPLAITLDLDDTLWPIWPTIERAEHHLHDWLRSRAPATAARFDRAGLREARDRYALAHPALLHDLSAIRRESLRQALLSSGDDPDLAEPAFDVFFEARQQVILYDDALQGLQRLAARYRVMAVTNGNADLARVGLAALFTGVVSARRLGVAKPDARIFHVACNELQCPPARVLHVGDDLVLDVGGALDAGLQAVWLHRGPLPEGGAPPLAAPYRVFADLTCLADALGC